MKKRYHWLSKALIFILILLTAALSFATTGLTLFLVEQGSYQDQGRKAREYVVTQMLHEDAMNLSGSIFGAIFSGTVPQDIKLADAELQQAAREVLTRAPWTPERTNLALRVRRTGTGDVLAESGTWPDRILGTVQHQYDLEHFLGDPYAQNKDSQATFNLELAVGENLTAPDRYQFRLSWLERLISWRILCPILAVVAAILCILLSAFLLHAIGRRPTADGFYLSFIDRIPLDLLIAGLAVLLYAFLPTMRRSLYPGLTLPVSLAVVIFVTVLLIVTLVSRSKTGRVFRNTLLWRGGAGLGRALQKLWSAVAWKPRWLLALAGLIFLDLLLFLVLQGNLAHWAMYWLISRILICWLIVRLMLQYQVIEQAGQKLATGSLDQGIATERLRGSFRTLGGQLNGLQNTVAVAVEEQLKGERLKTELITNVSHDIKTPVTTIVNFSELLAQEPLPDPRQQEYVAVISRQAARLKKLTEDLVEAAKIQSKTVTLEREVLNFSVAVNQALGEFNTRFEASGLTVVSSGLDRELCLMADGRKLWRILHNLFDNVAKYALSGTRVYLDLDPSPGSVQLSLRNISREQLNISGSELLERFVRGDSSRHSEGSGLGLSIAQNLTELMQGHFYLHIDGDLFRVVLTFPSCPCLPPQQDQLVTEPGNE